MAWSERQYDEQSQFKLEQPTNAVFWLLGCMVGAHVLKVILVGVGAVPPGSTEYWFGVSDFGLKAGYFWQPLTYFFVHGDEWHLFLNCLVLFFAARLLESLVGSRRTAIYALSCAVIGSLGVFPEAGAGHPNVGASGGIAGLWVIAWCLAPNLQVSIFVAVVRLKWVCGVFLLWDVLRAFGGGHTTFGSASPIAYWGHLYGALGGFLIAFVWPRFMAPRMRAAQQTVERKREVARIEREAGDERELDRILAKINTEGMSQLSEAERKFLKRRATKAQETPKR